MQTSLEKRKKSLSNSGHFSPIGGHEAFRIRLEKHPVGQVLVPQVNVAIQSILGNPFKLLLQLVYSTTKIVTIVTN